MLSYPSKFIGAIWILYDTQELNIRTNQWHVQQEPGTGGKKEKENPTICFWFKLKEYWIYSHDRGILLPINYTLGCWLRTLINDEEFINKNTGGSLPFSYMVCHKQILALTFIPITNLLSRNNENTEIDDAFKNFSRDFEIPRK